MTAFDDALASLHADPNLSRQAKYFVDGTGAGTDISVIWAEPETVVDVGMSSQIKRRVECDVKLSDIADPKAGDELESLNRYRVSEVLVDSEKLSARLTLKVIK